MAQIIKRTLVTLVMCLLVLAVSSAPADPAETTTSTIATTTTTTQALSGSSSTTSTTETPKEDAEAASSTTPTSAEPNSKLAHSNFTCYGRNIGYYADIATECKIYHFCVLGDYNGEAVYQRISYYCLNETVFDQQALDCVAKISAPCADSEKYYDESNKVLREAVHSTNSNSTSNNH